MNFVWTPLLFILTDAQFTSFPASTNTRCIGNELDLHWIYSVVTNNASSVEWKKDGLIMLTWIVEINNYGYENGYNSSKLVHNGNGNVDIKMLAPSDAGEYVCEVTYDVTGTTYPSTAVTLTVSSCPTVTTEMPFKSSSLDQTSSSQNPSTDTSKTQKTDTNRMSTTDNVFTSMSQHFTSDHEVTTQILNRSNNAMDFSVGAVIAIIISGIISVCLVVFLICLYLRRKHTRKQTSETPEPKLRRTNEKQNKEQYSRKNVRGQTIEPSTYPTDYYDSGNPRTKNLNKMSNHRQKHTNENKLSQSMQNSIEDKIGINYPSSRNHQTRANNRGPSIPLAHFAPNNSNDYRCVPTMLYVDPHEPHAYMYQDYFVYPAYTRVQDRQSGKRYYS